MTFYSLPFTPERMQATEARLEAIYEAARYGLKGDSLAMAAGLTPRQFRVLADADPLVEMAEIMIQPALTQNYSLYTDEAVLQERPGG